MAASYERANIGEVLLIICPIDPTGYLNSLDTNTLTSKLTGEMDKRCVRLYGSHLKTTRFL